MNRSNIVALAASVAINAGVLLGIASGIEETSLPRGEVIVTEIVAPGDAVLIANNGQTAAPSGIAL